MIAESVDSDLGSFYYSANPHDEEELCIRILKILVEVINSQRESNLFDSDHFNADDSDNQEMFKNWAIKWFLNLILRKFIDLKFIEFT